jgi:DNA-binding protein H-NS
MSNYIQIQAQIEQLQKEAEAARKREIAETVANIKKAIQVFGLTAEDLGLDSLIKGKRGRKPGKAAAKKAGAKGAKKTGAKRRGRPPKAAAAKPGRKPAKVKTAAKAKKSKVPKDKRSVVAPKYRDSATGATWTGRGKQPKWLASALASGKKIDDFKI